jgi:hypothetical protein
MESTSARLRILSSGQVAVLGMLALAVGAATFAWWWNYHRGRQALELFGANGAALVRSAKTVEIMATQQTDMVDISRAPGLLNARASLLNDASYDWQNSPPPLVDSDAAVRFRDGESSSWCLTLTRGE